MARRSRGIENRLKMEAEDARPEDDRPRDGLMDDRVSGRQPGATSGHDGDVKSVHRARTSGRQRDGQSWCGSLSAVMTAVTPAHSPDVGALLHEVRHRGADGADGIRPCRMAKRSSGERLAMARRPAPRRRSTGSRSARSARFRRSTPRPRIGDVALPRRWRSGRGPGNGAEVFAPALRGGQDIRQLGRIAQS